MSPRLKEEIAGGSVVEPPAVFLCALFCADSSQGVVHRSFDEFLFVAAIAFRRLSVGDAWSYCQEIFPNRFPGESCSSFGDLEF